MTFRTKTAIAFTVALITITINAQDSLYIYKDGIVVNKHELAKIDSVIFYRAEIPENNTVVTDIDGNVYNSVVIGTQTWMAENLKTTTYNDGTEIQYVEDDTSWSILQTGAYCWYNNDEVNYKEYGALYNWYTIEASKLCPTGWHVSTQNDWSELGEYLGSSAGYKLRETGTEHWNAPNSEASNESGFTALGSGFRNSDGNFYLLKSEAAFWTNESNNSYATWIRLYSDTFIIHPNGGNLNSGMSVRCVKD